MTKQIKSFTALYANFVIKQRKLIIVIVIALSLFMAIFIPSLKINPDVFDNLPKDDPVAFLFNKIGNEYGGNSQCIVGVEAENIFTKEILEDIRLITDSLKVIPGVNQVMSLTNMIDIRGSEWGIEVTTLLDEYDIPSDKKSLEKLKNYVLSKEMYKGAMVSEDASMTIISVRLANDIDQIKVSQQIKSKVESLRLKEKIHFGGMPFVTSAFGDVISKDISILGPISLVLILLVLYLSLRKLKGVILPVLNVLLSVVWTFGIMALLGIKISIITSIIPILLVAIGSAYAIHVLNRFYETQTTNHEESLKKTIAYIIKPVFFASITTIFGFMSFVFGSYLDMISKFGIFTSVGILVSLILSVSFTPAIMAVFPDKTSRRSKKEIDSKYKLMKQFLEKISHRIIEHPKRTVIIWGIVVLIFIFGFFHLERSVDVMSFLSKKNPNRITEKILQDKMGGTSPVYVSIKSDNVLNYATLSYAEEIEAKLKKNDEISNTRSITDLIRQMNDVMGEGVKVPQDEKKIENLWFMIEGQDILETMINHDKTEMIIQATFASTDLGITKDFVDDMSNYFEETQKEGITVSMTGNPSLMINLDQSLVKSQFQSLIIAIILVLIAVSFLTGTFLRGLFAIAPIIATLIILYGSMGLIGIPLDLATVLVGSISIGIGIDYSIHIINHYNHVRKLGYEFNDSIKRCITISGKAITINVLSVSAGFLILLLSSLVPLQRFGILVTITMLASGLGSITLLPALLVLRQNYKSKRQTFKS